MINLDYDIIREISYNLNFESILIFSMVNKNIYSALDNVFYKKLALDYYGRNFWLRAQYRPFILSRPLYNIKNELIRIEFFQKKLDLLNINRWTKKDFFNYWNYTDQGYDFYKTNNNQMYLNIKLMEALDLNI